MPASDDERRRQGSANAKILPMMSCVLRRLVKVSPAASASFMSRSAASFP